MESLRFPTVALIIALSALSCDQPPESPSSVLSSDGVQIRYEVHGSGEPAVVFVHGWTCDRSYWDEQVPYFSERFTVVTVDLAGHGESGLDREEWTMGAFGEDVTAVVEKLDLERVVLVGHSMGAPVTVETAQRIEDRLVGLVVVDDFSDLSGSMTVAEVEEMLAPFVDDFAGTTSSYVSATMFVPSSDTAMVNWIVEDMASSPPEVGTGAGRNLLLWYGQHADAALTQLHVPIHAINSDNIPTNLDAAARYGIEVTIMEGLGHFVMMEDPDTFNRLLSDIVEEFAGTE